LEVGAHDDLGEDNAMAIAKQRIADCTYQSVTLGPVKPAHVLSQNSLEVRLGGLRWVVVPHAWHGLWRLCFQAIDLKLDGLDGRPKGPLRRDEGVISR